MANRMYNGVIIKETLTDELLLDYLTIEKAEIWKTNDEKIKYWTMVYFHSENPNFPNLLANSIIEDWFADLKQDDIKYIVFRNCVYQYEIGNMEQKDVVLEQLRNRGIPDEQFQWEE